MSFDVLEQSTESGRPIRTYLFSFADGSQHWGYTSADTDQTVVTEDGTYHFQAVPINDDGVKFSGEKTADVLAITATSEIMPAHMYRRMPPSRAITVRIFDRHAEDPDFQVVYVGEIREVSFDSPGQVKFFCDALGSSLDREGLRLCWQRTCPYSVYEPTTCKLNPAAFGVSFFITGIDGFNVTVEGLTGQPNGRFNGGYIEVEHPTKGALKLTVEAHTGSLLVIFDGANELFIGQGGEVYPGCPHTPAACQAFGNYSNYGGVPSMPGKSPFDGNPVF